MKMFCSVGVPVRTAALLLALVWSAGIARATDPLRVETLLLWGTNDAQSPDPKHKPVDGDLAKKLGNSPYRWKYYFEVNRRTNAIPAGALEKNIKMSEHCALDIQNMGDGRAKVAISGDGKLLSTRTEPMKSDWPLIFSGAAKNDTAWLVVIKKIDTAPAKPEKPAGK
jgi:hypothetical protein